MENDIIGEFTNIKFKNGKVQIFKGKLEQNYDEDLYTKKQNVLIMCKYKILFKEMFDIDDFGEEICQFFEAMNYSLEIEEFLDGTKFVDVVDLTNMNIVSQSNDLLHILSEFELKRKEILVNI